MSKPIPFLRPKLVGKRFEGHAIPLEILKDLSVLEEMVSEVAKWLYLKDHPDRIRSPRGFTKGISLKLTQINEGSAIPAIDIFVDDLTLVPPQNQHYFVKAKESIIAAIDAAEHDEAVEPHMSESMLGYFDRIGRSLLADEAVEFNPKNKSRPARLNKQTRRKLILSSPKVTVLTEEVSLRGTIPEADQKNKTFQLQISSDQRVSAPIDVLHFDTVMEAFNGYSNGIRVLVQGIGRYSRSDKLQSVETVKHIIILPDNDIPTRIDELRKIKRGWLDGKGYELSQDGLDWLAQCFESLYDDAAPLPYIYPTAEGGVQAEWSSPQYEISLDIDFNTKQGEWHELNMSTYNEENQLIDLNKPDSWKCIARHVLERQRANDE